MAFDAHSMKDGGRPAAIPRTSPIIARLRHWRGRGFLTDDRVRHEA
jgi:hypothetical protein